MNISENKPVNKKKLIRTAAVILLLLTAAAVWWLIPVRPLRGYEPKDITRIEIEGFPEVGTVTLNEEETRIIAENLYECKAQRAGISYGRMGYVYKLHIFAGDKWIRTFSVITGDRGRDSLFFYAPANGSYCREYLDQLSEKYTNKDVIS